MHSDFLASAQWDHDALLSTIMGSYPAWLELYTKPKKSHGVIPDGQYYDGDSSRFQVNPIISCHQLKLFDMSNKFEASYNLVCNDGVSVFDTCFVPKKSSKLDKVQELCIFASCTRSRIMSLSIRTRSGSTANLVWCCRLVIFVSFLSSLMVRPLS